ncbi:MAG: hypothetical protein RRB13_13000 [bacterium]|nr:hypothetical protein [bacterium]
MSFWTSQKLLIAGEAPNSNLIIPFDKSNVKHGAYELSPGIEVKVSGTDKKKLSNSEEIRIPAGQIALVMTKECVQIPSDTIGFISLRSKTKMAGLVNVSGFHVDPGFHGHLIFCVFNASDREIVLTEGHPAFSLWLAEFEKSVDDPRKSPKVSYIDPSNSTYVGSANYNVASLKEEIKKLKDTVGWMKWAAGIIGAAVLAGLWKIYFGEALPAPKTGDATSLLLPLQPSIPQELISWVGHFIHSSLS